MRGDARSITENVEYSWPAAEKRRRRKEPREGECGHGTNVGSGVNQGSGCGALELGRPLRQHRVHRWVCNALEKQKEIWLARGVMDGPK